MIGVVVATHGPLAAALVETVRLVTRDTSHIVAVTIEQSDDANTFHRRLLEAVAQAKENRVGVVILTDLFGGTPSTLAMTLIHPGVIEVLTGVNLPMLVKVVQQMEKNQSVIEVARAARLSAVQSIALASEMLSQPNDLNKP